MENVTHSQRSCSFAVRNGDYPVMPMRYACEVHAREMHAYEVHAHEVYACEMHARKMHAHKTHTYEIHAREMHVYEVYAAVGALHIWEMYVSKVYREFRFSRIEPRGEQGGGRKMLSNTSLSDFASYIVKFNRDSRTLKETCDS
jgi:hypothetical protein